MKLGDRGWISVSYLMRGMETLGGFFLVYILNI